jgi:hypothetical protein
MTLDQIVKIQSVIDKRAIRSDTLEFLNHLRFSESKQSFIRLGDMHIDHFFRVVANIMPNDSDTNDNKTKEMFESIKKRILQEFNHGNN